MNEQEDTWLAPWWRELPKRWGHPWHSMCSYLAMFPPSLPRYFIEQCSRPGDTVFDPFAGRGTTPLEACLAGRVGIGGDANPLAVLLTKAKVEFPTLDQTLSRVEYLKKEFPNDRIREEAPPEIAMLFHAGKTLPQLMYLRRELSQVTKVDRFLLGALCGILHGNHPEGRPNNRTLSISMPNTFSMSPAYVERYIAKHELKKYPVDVFELLEKRLRHLYREAPPVIHGRAAQADAKESSKWIRHDSVSLVVTSPPYLHVVRYGKFNWIRLWLLKESVEATDSRLRVEETDTRLKLSDRLRLPGYCEFMRSTIGSVEKVLKPGGQAVFVIGDVDGKDGSSINLAGEVWKDVRKHVDLKLVDILEDRFSLDKKVTRVWGSRRGNATKVDRLLVVKKPGARKLRARPPASVIKQLMS